MLDSSIINKILIFENENFIVLNKPYGIPVHGGTKVNLSIASIFKLYYNKDIFFVHRIDKDTSGCLILAKNKKFLVKMQNLFKFNKIYKEYHALIKGKFKEILFTEFFDSVLNNYNVKIKPKMRITKNKYFLIDEFFNSSLIKILPFSGKMHQIRIHLSYIGCSIAGDLKYGSKFFNDEIRKLNLNRMFLHFNTVKFNCPIDKKFYNINAIYDKSLFYFINNIKRR